MATRKLQSEVAKATSPHVASGRATNRRSPNLLNFAPQFGHRNISLWKPRDAKKGTR